MTLWKLETVVGLDAVEAGAVKEIKTMREAIWGWEEEGVILISFSSKLSLYPALQSSTIDLSQPLPDLILPDVS